METSFIDAVRLAATRMGHCDPQWLKNGEPPPIETVEGGTEGPEMVLLHGLFGALSNWEGVFPFLSSFARPIALKFPLLTGHRSEVKVKALALLTEYFVRSRHLAPVILCGNSMGGHVALRLALASPELVDCLILTGSSGLYEHTVDSLPIRPDERFVREHMERVFYDYSLVTDERVNEIAAILKTRSNVLNLIDAARSAKKDNLQSLLTEVKVPTLLLWGKNDQITTMDVAQTFHKRIPRSELVTIDNCGHAPMIEHPQWFASQVERFVRTHSRYFRR